MDIRKIRNGWYRTEIRLKLKETCYNELWNSLKSKGHQILKRNKQQ